jgi:polysaccharide transporter, PST family
MTAIPSSSTSSAEKSSANAIEVALKTARAIWWSTGQQLATNIVTFGGYIVLARLLQPKDFGLFAFASVFTVLLQSFTDQGIPDAVVQRAKLEKAHLDTAFWFNMVLSFGLAGLLWITAPIASSLVHEPGLCSVLRCLVWILPLSALGGIHQALLKRRMEYRTLGIQNFAATIAGTATGVLLAWNSWGIWCLVGQQIASVCCLTLVAWLATRWVPSFELRLAELRELGHFSVHITAGALLDFINRRADDFLIGIFLGATALGYYSLAYRLLLTFTRLVSSPFNSVAFSAFSRLQNEPEERCRMFDRLAQLVAALAFPAFLGLAAVSPDLIRVGFGPLWLPSVPVLQILCFIGVLHSVVFLHGTLIRAAGRPDWQMLFTLGGALTNLIGFCFVVRYGMIYVALWYVFSAYLWLGVDLMLVKRILGHSTSKYLRSFLPALTTGMAVSIVMLVAQKFLPGDLASGFRLMLELAAGALALALLHHQILLNPRRSLRTAGLMPNLS